MTKKGEDIMSNINKGIALTIMLAVFTVIPAKVFGDNVLKPVITKAEVVYDSTDTVMVKINVFGGNFGAAAGIVKLGDTSLQVENWLPQEIVADLPQGIGPGSYLLTVAVGEKLSPVATLGITLGDTGPQGEPGPAGPAGSEGAMGPQGGKGDTGATGATGPQGPAGPQGPEGQVGPMGPIGLTGPIGPQGPQGPQGNDGSPGLPGVCTLPVCAPGEVILSSGSGIWICGRLCSGMLVDPRIDPANCGECGHACAPAETCAAAVCISAGSEPCVGACAMTCGPLIAASLQARQPMSICIPPTETYGIILRNHAKALLM